jgi:flagellar basal body rod protein FlgG
MESLEMLANNLANATTIGFKADREYYSTYFAPEALAGPSGTVPAIAPVIENNWTDYSQGTLIATGNALDVALAGPGFFVADGPNGPLYTRNGNFRLSVDGTLVTQEGYPVRGEQARPLRLNAIDPIEIDAEGVVRQQGLVMGRIDIVDFSNHAELGKTGSSYFRFDGQGQPFRSSARVEQARLESANFHPAEGAVRLVGVLRQFEMLQRALTLGNEMNRRAIEEVARVRE